MSLLSLMQLAVTPTASVLSVVNLVKRVTQHFGNLSTRGVQYAQLSFDGLQLSVIVVGVRQ